MSLKNIVVVCCCLFGLLSGCGDKVAQQQDTKPVAKSEPASFVSVHHGQFWLQHKPYYFTGANFWQGGYLGVDKGDNRARLTATLDQLSRLGVTNLRVLAISESSQLARAVRPAIEKTPGSLDEQQLQGLDFLLAEMAKRHMKAVLMLSNFWQWSGGMSQYVAWDDHQPAIDPDKSGDWDGYMDNVARFYPNKAANQTFHRVIRQLIERKNTLTGVQYNNDPTIMTWELANEPRPGSQKASAGQVKAFIHWVGETARFIHQLAPNQLVTTGSEGTKGTLGNSDIYLQIHMLPSIDYATFHLWPFNWQWFDPKHAPQQYDEMINKAKQYIARHLHMAGQINKPLVLEEFGLPRDNGQVDPQSTTQWRDKFYTQVYQQWQNAARQGANAGGTNFWAWSGAARSPRADHLWQSGDPLMGDPPQEPQGLNSVFDTDASTLNVIKAHSADIKALINQPGIADKVEKMLAQMTLAEKIGQMTQAERTHVTPQQVHDYFLGSVLNGGGSVPGDNTPKAWRNMIDAYQHGALSTRLGIPIIYGTDAVHGHGNAKNTTLFPHNVGLGAMRDPQIMEKIGRITAAETAAYGVHWDFAPDLCVTRDERWGRAYECFGESPDIGVSYAGPYVKGLQASGQLIGTAKHWVGDGGTTYGTGDHGYIIDRGDTRVTMDELRRIHIAPYIPAIKQGVGSVMFSYSSVNGVKMHENGALNNGILKGELGFKGFVVSDWEAIGEVHGETNKERIVKSINAGLDMAMEPEHWQAFIRDLTAAVNEGDVPLSRINDAVRRILTAKYQLGLFARPYSDDRSVPARLVVGTAAHRAVARQAVAESMVVLKNANQVLPLSHQQDVFVAGSHADNIGLQSGGWSIQWQGEKHSDNQGTTILQGIRQKAAKVTYREDGSGAAGHDVAVVVVGEQPYAEGWGDYNVQPCKYCQPLTLSKEDQATIKRVKASGIPMVVVLISGRPLLIADQLPGWDGLMAAWLPGTEGEGVADVLFGDHPPTGKLSVSWPKNLQQIPINVGDKDYDPLFKYGFGLTYH